MKTKKLSSLLSVAFLLPLLSFAQTTTYRSYFGEEFTHWYTMETHYDLWGSYLYLVDGDTILLNGMEYKKLYYSGHSENFYHWGIREEAETGSLFIYEEGDSEVLVSRMDLEIGDKYYFSVFREEFEKGYYCREFCFNDIKEDEHGYYTTVDSIYYEDGRKHIQFETMFLGGGFFDNIPFTFIEGIGPNISFEPIAAKYSGASFCFLCHETESESWHTSFFNPESWDYFPEDCLIGYDNISEINPDTPLQLTQRKNEIEVHPDVNVFTSGWIYVYSTCGDLLYTQPVERSANIIIPTSGFSNGACIILLKEGKTGKVWSRKVIL